MTSRWARPVTLAVVPLIALLTAAPGCTSRPQPPARASPSTTAATAQPSRTSAAGPDPVLVGAGDIATCDGDGDSRTAALLAKIPGTVYTLGDNAYTSGTAAEFAHCYGPTWGAQKARTRPVIGNHEYVTPRAAGYFGYFGAAAGEPGKGYYSYNLGTWHVVVLNSNCTSVSCATGSGQQRWLRADLAANPARCTLAMWHHPLFTSGQVHLPATEVRPLFRTLYDAGADVVLSGHNHQYERFAPQDPSGAADPSRGIRQFVVGTGGGERYGFGRIRANSQIHNGTTFGVLMLTLHPTGYDWRFVPEAGKTFTDTGHTTCH